MKPQKLGMFVAVATVLLIAQPTRADKVDFGDSAPMAGAKMRNVDGKKVSIEDVKGEKGTLVIFTCNHCPYVKAWESRIAAIGNAALAQGVGVIAVNSNDPKAFEEDSYDEMKKRSKALGLKFPYTVDRKSALARAYGATRTPEVFLFDSGMKLVYRGTIDDSVRDADKVSKTYLKDAIADVSAGRAVRIKETKALGCSIKFRDGDDDDAQGDG